MSVLRSICGNSDTKISADFGGGEAAAQSGGSRPDDLFLGSGSVEAVTVAVDKYHDYFLVQSSDREVSIIGSTCKMSIAPSIALPSK